ncbi:MAG: hypothetical protein C0467_25750 [Planctomycetaceae bacterium]|nr:hypothetical protein [Planctomycetaceae bacterium]
MSLILLAAMLAAEPEAGRWVGNDTIASPDGKLIYTRGKDGLEAIDVATGKLIWVTKGANRLAGVSGRTVIAWAADAKKPNAFSVVAIDSTTGKMLFKSDTITMPDWASTAKEHGFSFRTAARSDGKQVVVVWQANTFYAGGARPTPEIEAAARREALGSVVIDAATGKTTVEDRKPKDSEFGTFNNKVGDLEFGIEEELPAFKPGVPMVTKVTLSALKGDKVIWKRELAGNPWSPPRP